MVGWGHDRQVAALHNVFGKCLNSFSEKMLKKKENNEGMKYLLNYLNVWIIYLFFFFYTILKVCVSVIKLFRLLKIQRNFEDLKTKTREEKIMRMKDKNL